MRWGSTGKVPRNTVWEQAVRDCWRLIRGSKSPREAESLYARLVAFMAQVPPHLRIAFGGAITPPYRGRCTPLRTRILSPGLEEPRSLE